MARRSRNEKALPELVFGLFIFVVAITILNPKLREQILSTITAIVSFIVLLGILGGIIYLIIQLKKYKLKSAFSALRRPILSRPVNGYSDGPSLNYEAVKQPVLASSSFLTDEVREEIKARYNPIQPVNNPTFTPQDIFAGIRNNSIYTRSWHVSVLREIEWKRFEIVCTEYLKLSGYIAKETNIGADGGVDIRVSKSDDENFKGIVQCKAWNIYKVGVKPIRELFGIMAAEHIQTGIFITSGAFTSEAEVFANGKIELVWGEKLISLIRKFSESDQANLLNTALAGDYKTPTCPQCDIKMSLRESKKGKNVGGYFWGCVRYPRCKQTLSYKESC